MVWISVGSAHPLPVFDRCPPNFHALITDLLSLPMLTIAAVSGHASAAGLILALTHDYILMRKDRGFLYMSEMDSGLKIPAWCMSLIRCKIGDPKSRRDLVLKASKITAKQVVQMGILDAAYESPEDTAKQAAQLAEELAGKGWDGKVHSENRLGLLKGVLDNLGSDDPFFILSKI